LEGVVAVEAVEIEEEAVTAEREEAASRVREGLA
jgi:hypothetical protein